jgi:hypothetical protein
VKFLLAAILAPVLAWGSDAQSLSPYANPPAVVYVHSWLPQTGPLPRPPSHLEDALLRVSERARAGDFLEAIRILDKLRTDNPDPQTTYLTLLFERDVMMRRTWLIADEMLDGGESQLQNALNLIEYGRLSDQMIEAARRAGQWHLEQVEIADRYTDFIVKCMVSTPQRLREDMLSEELPELDLGNREGAASRQRCSDLLRKADPGRMLNVIDPTSQQLLQLWTEARMDAAMGKIEEAAWKLEEGAAIAIREHWSSAANYWLLARGDLDLAPYGNPLTLGYDVGSEGIVRQMVAAGVQSKVIAPITPTAKSSALNWYQKAVDAPKSELDIRYAYLRFLGSDPNTPDSFRDAATSAQTEEKPRLRAYALVGQFFTENDPLSALSDSCGLGIFKQSGGNCFTQAVGIALEQRDLGTILGLAELARSVAERTRISGEPERAARILQSAERPLLKSGHERVAANILFDAAHLNSVLGQEDLSIYELIQDVEIWRKWIELLKGETARTSQADRRFAPITWDNEYRMYALDLGALLNALHSKVVLEGEDSWMIALAKYEALAEGMLKGNSDPSLASIWREYVEEKRRAVRTTPGNEMSRRANCSEIILAFDALEVDATTNFAEWSDVASPAAYCDSRIGKQVGDVLLGLKPVDAVRVAAQEYQRSRGFRSQEASDDAIRRMHAYFVMAGTLERGDVLEAYALELTRVIKDLPGVLDRLVPYADLYLAMAQILQGHPAPALDILTQLQSQSQEYLWLSADHDFQAQLAAELSETNLLLGKEEEALLDTEWMRMQLELSHEPRGEVRRSMLVRKAILGPDALSDAETMELLMLERLQNPWAVTKPPDVAALKRDLGNLPPNTVLLVLYPVRFSVLAWRIELGQAAIFKRLPWKPIEDSAALRSLSGATINRMTSWDQPAQALYDVILRPLGPLPPGATVAILAGSSLQRIPFELLGPDREHPLIMQHPVVYLNQLIHPPDVRGPREIVYRGRTLTIDPTEIARKLGIIDTVAQKRRDVVVAGSSLESASEEVDAVAKMLGVSPIVGSRASVDEVQKALWQSRRVHIAAHGVIDQSNPFRSYLELSDGRLEAWQLSGSTAASELVVLSACDTKRGPDRSLLEDTTSIASLASLGGARRIISSIRPADDGYTLELMRLFYQRLDGDPARALQAAKVALITGIGGDANRYADFILTVRDISSILMARN